MHHLEKYCFRGSIILVVEITHHNTQPEASGYVARQFYILGVLGIMFDP